MMKIQAFLLILVLMTGIYPLTAQETAETENTETPAAVYTDALFNDYIELETEVLGMIEDGSIERYVLGRIESMKTEASESNRRDIVSRLGMLAFAAESGLREKEISADPEKFRASVAAEEKKLRGDIDSSRTAQSIAPFTIGTAVLSGTIFAVSSVISSSYYEKYTLTEYADQAAFYLFWWQLLDKVAFVSGITSLVTSVTAGVLTAIY